MFDYISIAANLTINVGAYVEADLKTGSLVKPSLTMNGDTLVGLGPDVISCSGTGGKLQLTNVDSSTNYCTISLYLPVGNRVITAKVKGPGDSTTVSYWSSASSGQQLIAAYDKTVSGALYTTGTLLMKGVLPAGAFLFLFQRPETEYLPACPCRIGAPLIKYGQMHRITQTGATSNESTYLYRARQIRSS